MCVNISKMQNTEAWYLESFCLTDVFNHFKWKKPKQENYKCKPEDKLKHRKYKEIGKENFTITATEPVITDYHWCKYNSTISMYELTHFWLNKLPPHYILEESNFSFRYVRLCDLDIPREKWQKYLQTVETLIILWHLIWVCSLQTTLLRVSRLKWVNSVLYICFTKLVTLIKHFKFCSILGTNNLKDY